MFIYYYMAIFKHPFYQRIIINLKNNMLQGGFSAPREPTKKETDMVAYVRWQVKERTNKQYEFYTPVLLTSQEGAGTNYNVKVQVGEDEFIHVKIFRPLPHINSPISVTAVETGKAFADPL